MKKKNISITESEWHIMMVVWNDSPQTLQEILDKLSYSGWSKTTIQTYIARLVKKGMLLTERKGKGYLYYPAVSKKDFQYQESKSFLKRVYNGSLYQMVLGFTKSGTLSYDELEELKKLIIEQEEK